MQGWWDWNHSVFGWEIHSTHRILGDARGCLAAQFPSAKCFTHKTSPGPPDIPMKQALILSHFTDE